MDFYITLAASALLIALYLFAIPMLALQAAAIGGVMQNARDYHYKVPEISRHICMALYLISCFSPFWCLPIIWYWQLSDYSSLGYYWFLSPFIAFLVSVLSVSWLLEWPASRHRRKYLQQQKKNSQKTADTDTADNG